MKYVIGKPSEKPTVVCLCGSTRFSEAYQQANLSETLAGRIVLTIGCDMRTNTKLFDALDKDTLENLKWRLDELHKRKIDLANEILVLNVDGYVGESTRSGIEYAMKCRKRVRWLEPSKVPEELNYGQVEDDSRRIHSST